LFLVSSCENPSLFGILLNWKQQPRTKGQAIRRSEVLTKHCSNLSANPFTTQFSQPTERRSVLCFVLKLFPLPFPSSRKSLCTVLFWASFRITKELLNTMSGRSFHYYEQSPIIHRFCPIVFIFLAQVSLSAIQKLVFRKSLVSILIQHFHVCLYRSKIKSNLSQKML